MATDVRLVQGQVIDDSKGEQKDVEALLLGLLNALIAEQQEEQ